MPTLVATIYDGVSWTAPTELYTAGYIDLPRICETPDGDDRLWGTFTALPSPPFSGNLNLYYFNSDGLLKNSQGKLEPEPIAGPMASEKADEAAQLIRYGGHLELYYRRADNMFVTAKFPLKNEFTKPIQLAHDAPVGITPTVVTYQNATHLFLPVLDGTAIYHIMIDTESSPPILVKEILYRTSGNILGAPTAIVYQGNLYIAHYEMVGAQTLFRYHCYDGLFWSTTNTVHTDRSISSTTTRPSMAVYNGLLYMVYCTSTVNPAEQVRYRRYDGNCFGSEYSIPFVKAINPQVSLDVHTYVGSTTSKSPRLYCVALQA